MMTSRRGGTADGVVQQLINRLSDRRLSFRIAEREERSEESGLEVTRVYPEAGRNADFLLLR